MNDQVEFHRISMNCIGFLTIVTYFAGAWICLDNRRLSRPLVIVAIGFAGEFLSSAIEQINSMIWRFPRDHDMQYTLLFFLSLNVIRLLSRVMLVLGLVASLVDIHRKLALSMKSTPLDEI